ncbi:cysteine-rich CWC family protein [Aquimarina longa]|uniref:cysteine-rich CWC family protein n=1 Tax=Aquimarina longa TaxID=1080221 RepID=UPI00078059C4|nr:cysteine-rich CWC family protein [Aquimarina longa]
MTKHEEKYCPKCNSFFECKVGSILLCQCTFVKLSNDELKYINSKHEDCLCAECMKMLKAEYHNQNFQNKLKSILGIFYKNQTKK